MGQDEKLRTTHDVAERLQRKLEGAMDMHKGADECWLVTGLADVERAFVHVDYDGVHDIGEEHKPLYSPQEAKAPLLERMKEKLPFKHRAREVAGNESVWDIFVQESLYDSPRCPVIIFRIVCTRNVWMKHVPLWMLVIHDVIKNWGLNTGLGP